MHWLLFLFLSAVIVGAGRFLARDGDILAEKTGMGRTWMGTVLVAATTSLPELFTGIGAAGAFGLPDIAVGDILGSCMFNLLILSMMDIVARGTPLSARASRGHALSIGFGSLLVGLTGVGLVTGAAMPTLGWLGWSTPLMIVAYLIAAQCMFYYERRQAVGVVVELHHANVPLRKVVLRYTAAAAVVVTAAIFLPEVGAAIAAETGLGQSFVATALIAVATSLPEVAVSLAAVRMGAIDLAIGNVLGSNLFNILILGLDDILYTKGPILAAVSPKHTIAAFAVLAMNGILLAGLTYQAATKRLVLAWDTLAIAVVYVMTLWVYLAL
jgi:cation:H+ antiporter